MLPAEEPPSDSFVVTSQRKWQYVMDKLSPQVGLRWVIFGCVFGLYFLRVFNLQGWYIVTYGLGIYLLNQLIGFLSPQVPNIHPIFNPNHNNILLLNSLTQRRVM